MIAFSKTSHFSFLRRAQNLKFQIVDAANSSVESTTAKKVKCPYSGSKKCSTTTKGRKEYLLPDAVSINWSFLEMRNDLELQQHYHRATSSIILCFLKEYPPSKFVVRACLWAKPTKLWQIWDWSHGSQSNILEIAETVMLVHEASAQVKYGITL